MMPWLLCYQGNVVLHWICGLVFFFQLYHVTFFIFACYNSSIQSYGESGTSGGEFNVWAFTQSIGVFAWTFSSSFLIGGAMGCGTALLTKFTHVRDFPLLETALFVLMSYSTFLIAEVADLTGMCCVISDILLLTYCF